MSESEALYLGPNIQAEPLVDHWYAWSHLIPPATAARNITERHLKIMDSYLNAPQVHAAAVKNPKMLGGPFIDYDGKRLGEIRALRDWTKDVRADMLELSRAIGELDNLLKSSAKGFSLAPLYPSVPAPLRGYVELIYDLNNNASFRVVEPLLYRSKYHDTTTQSLMLSRTSCDDRPFVLSTPRLESDDAVHLRVPFHDESVNHLFRLKQQPRPFNEILDLIPVPAKGRDLFRSFLTPQRPRPYQPYEGKGVRWRYFGHACILIETAGVSMLFDPVVSYTYENNVPRYTFEDLPDKIDFVLLTHNHQDHVMFETLLQIRHKVGAVIVPQSVDGSLQDPSMKLLFEKCGFRNVIELGEMEELPFEGGSITGLPFFGEHSDLNVRSKIAYMVHVNGHKLMFAADSCNVEPMLYEHIVREVGPADALFLGMECDGAPLTWLYGPLLSTRIERAHDESRRLSGSNYEQAISIVEQFRCKEVYVYAMGQEPWLNYVMSIKYTPESRPIVESNKLISTCAARGITGERLFGEKEILLD
jgi:L-ascorbate metabolism protein UlaG (beta-lactamase superfamily)